MSENPKSLIEQASELAHESLTRLYAMPPEPDVPPTQGERIEIPAMSDGPYCWSCNQPGGEMLDFGGVHIHNKPECRHTAGILDDEPKHDGKLAGHHSKRVQYCNPASIFAISVGYGDEDTALTAEEALSLLAWLKQEEAELQRLAKEQQS